MDLEARSWAPRPAITPRTRRSPAGTFIAESNGSDGCYGGWEISFGPRPSPDWIAAEVKVRWSDLADGIDSLQALVQWRVEQDDAEQDGVQSWAPLRVVGHEGEWLRLSTRPLEPIADARLTLRLLLRWSATGLVEWADPRVSVANAPAARTLRLGAASSTPCQPTGSLEENRDRYGDVCHRAADEGVDLLCLPETILSYGLPEPSPGQLLEHAVPVPGEHIDYFAAIAKERKMSIAFSVLEQDGDLVYNTAVLVDTEGSIALRYRKVHLAIREAWRGVSPGRAFGTTDVPALAARVGMNICMDSSSAESARIVARLGAEILLLPIENDFRATQWKRIPGESGAFSLPRWTLIQSARAIDNHLYVVAARNGGVGTGVFSPDGTVLAMDYGESSLVTADVDLADLRSHPTGPPYKDVIWFQRREAAYRALLGEQGAGESRAEEP